MNRGLNRRLIFSDKTDYPLFLDTLAEACSLFNVGAGAFCLMPNHYHLLVHTPEGNLSRFMRHLNGVYTQRFNRKYRRDGPLFRGRFKGILVEDDAYLLQVTKYIHRNPVKDGLCETLSGYAWSSHKHFVSSRHKTIPEWMETDYILGHFSENRDNAVAGYKRFMRQELDKEVVKFYSKKNQPPVLGDKSFVERIRAKYILGGRELNLEIKGERAIRGLAIVRKINKAVCGQFNVTEKNLYKTQRGEENIPRQIALCLARELSGLGHIELAKEYKSKSYKTVASSVYRFKVSLIKNKTLADKYSLLKDRCSQAET